MSVADVMKIRTVRYMHKTHCITLAEDVTKELICLSNSMFGCTANKFLMTSKTNFVNANMHVKDMS